MQYSSLLSVVLFLPLIGALYAGLFGAKAKALHVGVFNSLCVLVSFIGAVVLFIQAWHHQSYEKYLFDWIVVGNFKVGFSLMLDNVNAVMIVVVTLVSFLVHVYSIGYMEHDTGFNRYFSYLSGFVFSMLVLVLSDNFLGLFIGWEGVGLCSYLLIGFWYHKTSANDASIEAFVMNRITDLGMLMGIILIFWNFGTLQYKEVFSMLNNADYSMLFFISVFLFIGAMGKSAQFPMHTWLANAMEGPTPVSALIHAATMVTAGVYLVIRANPLYSAVFEVGYFIACLGAFVALFGASMALVNKDLKRIVAYSTLSQLGYMFVAAGLGAYAIALFHLFTHAFFKSLLFLGSGNVMHAMEDNLDITKMGALYKPMKITAIFMIIGSVALCGIYPFAGYFSKDKILEVAFGMHHHILWFVLLIGAIFTAFYSFRLIMLVFFAPKQHEINHPHEAKNFMLLSMLPLGILAVIAGFFEEPFFHFISQVIPSVGEYSVPLALLISITTIVVLLSIAYAIFKYKNGITSKKEGGFLYKLLLNQYYIPQLYQGIAKVFSAIASFLHQVVELRIIDAIVDTIGRSVFVIGRVFRISQDGNLTSMLRFMVAGVLILLAFVAFFGR
ncbi:NADH-quinone oxidoreductase subunit L [Helicobacter pylori]|uniref:NADH-quinone oxidoreductase subunit L n=1 Tax=Helicobacter pylori TaxID=210 RepID=UPI000BE99A49|nr:NADH-quinone oxidoreductase subunit L [Helicobacter pylori]PDW37453.1 NADH-quinone oxidoreductase subunit L [Helicobacter pylori]WQU63570.1 NADH-quinone oxidoreductase subunit L [Helicobacter pylori]